MARGSVQLIRIEDKSVLCFDAVVSVKAETNANITEHPVETGSMITDHVQLLPKRLTLVGVVTETPFRSAVNLPGLSGLTGPARVLAAWNWLKSSVGKLLNLTTDRYGTFSNVLLQNFPLELTGTRGNRFQITLKEIVLVEPVLVQIPAEIVAAAEETPATTEQVIDGEIPVYEDNSFSLTTEVNAGSQPTTDVTETEAEQVTADESILLELAQGAGYEV